VVDPPPPFPFPFPAVLVNVFVEKKLGAPADERYRFVRKAPFTPTEELNTVPLTNEPVTLLMC